MRIESLLHPHEEVLIFLRRDHFVVFKIVMLYSALMLLPLLAYLLVSIYLPGWLEQQAEIPLLEAIFVLAGSIYYLYVWIFMFRAWLDYYLDVWFVTTQRVVSIEQKGLFNRVVAEQKLFRIQDVHAEVKGIIPTFLDYGDVIIQTAGREVLFVFKEVPHPHQVARNLVKLVEWDKRNRQKEIQQEQEGYG